MAAAPPPPPPASGTPGLAAGTVVEFEFDRSGAIQQGTVTEDVPSGATAFYVSFTSQLGRPTTQTLGYPRPNDMYPKSWTVRWNAGAGAVAGAAGAAGTAGGGSQELYLSLAPTVWNRAENNSSWSAAASSSSRAEGSSSSHSAPRDPRAARSSSGRSSRDGRDGRSSSSSSSAKYELRGKVRLQLPQWHSPCQLVTSGFLGPLCSLCRCLCLCRCL